MFDLNIVDGRSLYIFSYTYFSKKKQLHVVQREIIEGAATAIVENYKEYKNNPKYEILFQKDGYAVFQEKGLNKFLTSHLKPTAGMNAFINYFILDM